MATDFGDESGEKLFDWILKIGQDASEQAMLASAEKLKSALQERPGRDRGRRRVSRDGAARRMGEAQHGAVRIPSRVPERKGGHRPEALGRGHRACLLRGPGQGVPSFQGGRRPRGVPHVRRSREAGRHRPRQGIGRARKDPRAGQGRPAARGARRGGPRQREGDGGGARQDP